MVDVALMVIAGIVPFLLLAANTILLLRFVDPQHASGHWFTKVVIILALLLAECTVLLLPLDAVSATK